MVGVAWSPGTACHHICTLRVRGKIARREAVLHSKTVEEGLDGGSHLTASAHNHIVHKVRIVEASYVCLHLARLRIHTHKSGAEERLDITYAVNRCHRSVKVAVVCEERHVRRRMERLVNFLVRSSCCLQSTITLALQNGTFHNLIDLLLCQSR